jgi:hypothetical protein
MNSWTGGTELCEASQTAVLERDKVGTVWGLAYPEHQRPALCLSLMRRYGPALASDSRSDTLFLIGNNRNANPNANPGGSGTTGAHCWGKSALQAWALTRGSHLAHTDTR